MSANISKPKLREKLDALFAALSGLTQELVTFVSVTVTGALSAASATITGAATVGTTLGVTGALTAASATLTGALKAGGGFGASSHSYASAAADWTLSTAEQSTTLLTVTLASGAVNAIATPTAGKVFVVLNTCGQALTFKAADQTGIVVANTKVAVLVGNGTDFIRVTADA